MVCWVPPKSTMFSLPLGVPLASSQSLTRSAEKQTWGLLRVSVPPERQCAVIHSEMDASVRKGLALEQP